MKEYSKAVKKADMILYTIVIFWVSISIWASFASLEEVTSGQGRIIASSKIQIIQNLEGGIIDDIFVKSGDIVSKDEASSFETMSPDFTNISSIIPPSRF